LTYSINLKSAAGIYYQYLHRVPRAFVADIWVASNKYQKGSSATHAILGFTKDFSNEFQLEIETFYKEYDNIYSFNQNVGVDIRADEFVNEEPIYLTTRGVFNRGEGDTKGFEMLLRKEYGAFTGWLGYSLSFTKYQIDGVNQDKRFAPRHDRTHAVNFVTNIDWKNLRRSWRGERPIRHKSNWKFGFTFIYTSGQPITLPGSAYFTNTLPDRTDIDYRQYPSVINSFRLPPYARLDVSITYERHFKSWSIFPYLQIFNVGNRKNIWFIQYEHEDDQAKIDPINMFPILPTIGVSFKF
jgi:hypothetical protein